MNILLCVISILLRRIHNTHKDRTSITKTQMTCGCAILLKLGVWWAGVVGARKISQSTKVFRVSCVRFATLTFAKFA